MSNEGYADRVVRQLRAVPPGIRAMAIGAFWFSVMGLLVKLAGRRIPAMQVVSFRVGVTLILSYIAVRRARLVSVLGQQRRLLLFRGFMGSLGLMCFYYSLVHLPLGEANLIQYTNPIFATIIAALWIGEHVGKAERWCIAAAVLGVALITRPASIFGGTTSSIDPLNVVVALTGAIASGAAYATVRRMGKREHPSVVVFYLPLVAIPLTIPVAIAQWVPPTPMEWLLLIGVGVATQIAQVYMTRGLQAETAVRATTTGYLQVVFAAIWGAVVFGERPTLTTLLGGTLIIGGAVLLALRGSRDMQKVTRESSAGATSPPVA